MKKKRFELSRRLEVIFAHIKTAREVEEVFTETDDPRSYQTSLISYLQGHLPEQIPGLRSWKEPVAKKETLEFSPADTAWHVVRGDSISLQIFVPDPKQTDLFGNPSVNLCAPEKWRKLPDFTRMLKSTKLPAGWEHTASHEGEDFDESCPIFAYVRIEDYAKGGHFDSKGFIEQFVVRSRELVEFKPTIDKLLEKLKRQTEKRLAAASGT